mgnify:CR=1 FL=1
MNKSIDIEILELKKQIVAVLNESPLPACIEQLVLSDILNVVSSAANQEYMANMEELKRQEIENERQTPEPKLEG